MIAIVMSTLALAGAGAAADLLPAFDAERDELLELERDALLEPERDELLEPERFAGASDFAGFSGCSSSSKKKSWSLTCNSSWNKPTVWSISLPEPRVV
jgi:hypothetical protein